MSPRLRRVGLAAEGDSPENPDGAEVRVALAPAAVRALCDAGCDVAVEAGAGLRVGFADDDYRAAGAAIVSRADLYPGRDLVVKLKGPAHRDLRRMDPGSTLCCMAHVRSIPERAAIADERGVNVLALELVTHRPRAWWEAWVRAREAMRAILAGAGAPARELSIAFAGFDERAFGALQLAGGLRPRSLALLADPGAAGPEELVVTLGDGGTLARADPGVLPDLDRPAERRKVECLHLTGRAGAAFGIDLALAVGRPRAPDEMSVTVMGYGNVAFGALDECVRRGVPRTSVLTRRTSARSQVGSWLRSSDLVVNGIERYPENSSRWYAIRDGDLGRDVRPGTVVVDLVGGSSSNRGVVEPLVECTHPGDPYRVVEGVYLSAVWGWPLVGFAKESADRYSEQILDLLLRDERLVDGLDGAPETVTRALVAGPLARACRSR